MRTGAEITRVEPRFADTAPPLPNFLGNAGSIYLIRSSNETVKPKEEAASADREEIVKKLAAIFGLKKVDSHPFPTRNTVSFRLSVWPTRIPG